MDLVILAAGMGSRFGGLKQIEPIDKNNNFIIDYSIYDAIKAGFDRVVFIIKEENFNIFKQTVGNRVSRKIKVEYVFQKNDNLPKGITLPEDRVKPLGTAHAILCCKDVVKDDFIIINADDFYGRDAFMVASKFLKENNDINMYGLVGYNVINTLTENGSVKRGVCFGENGYLKDIIESSIDIKNGIITCLPLDCKPMFTLNNTDTVSMNMFAFTPKIFEYLNIKFAKFFDDNKNDLSKCEYLMPSVVDELIKEHKVKTKILNTTAKWHGVTYKEDKPQVVASIQKMIDDGLYPQELWR